VRDAPGSSLQGAIDANPTHRTGFKLVKLMIVIPILGILSPVALPRFINLGRDASLAAPSSTEGALLSAVALARTKCLLTTGCNTAGTVNNIQMEGTGSYFFNGHPNGGETDPGFVRAGPTCPTSPSCRHRSRPRNLASPAPTTLPTATCPTPKSAPLATRRPSARST